MDCPARMSTDFILLLSERGSLEAWTATRWSDV